MFPQILKFSMWSDCFIAFNLLLNVVLKENSSCFIFQLKQPALPCIFRPLGKICCFYFTDIHGNSVFYQVTPHFCEVICFFY